MIWEHHHRWLKLYNCTYRCMRTVHTWQHVDVNTHHLSKHLCELISIIWRRRREKTKSRMHKRIHAVWYQPTWHGVDLSLKCNAEKHGKMWRKMLLEPIYADSTVFFLHFISFDYDNHHYSFSSFTNSHTVAHLTAGSSLMLCVRLTLSLCVIAFIPLYFLVFIL